MYENGKVLQVRSAWPMEWRRSSWGDWITAISICGMGGEPIRDIFDSGQEHLALGRNGE